MLTCLVLIWFRSLSNDSERYSPLLASFYFSSIEISNENHSIATGIDVRYQTRTYLVTWLILQSYYCFDQFLHMFKTTPTGKTETPSKNYESPRNYNWNLNLSSVNSSYTNEYDTAQSAGFWAEWKNTNHIDRATIFYFESIHPDGMKTLKKKKREALTIYQTGARIW